MRAAFAVWTTPKATKPTKSEDSEAPKTDPSVKLKGSATSETKEPMNSKEQATSIKKDIQETPIRDGDKNSEAAIRDETPTFSPDVSFNTQEQYEVLPLSAANLIKSTEEEEQRVLARIENSHSLPGHEMREVIMTRRIKKWLTQADPQNSKEETESDGFRIDDGKMDGGVKISPEENVQDHTDAASSNPYIIERTERVAAAKERISILKRRNKIRPGIFLFLRHAMHIDAEGLAGVVNSYVQCSAYTLETKLISVHDIYQRINDSRSQELPFIVAIKQSEEKDYDSRVPWGRILGFVRLTNFLQGQSSVSNTAQLEIIVAQNSKGQKVGRCLMDAMLTIADPNYSPRGGYLFESNIPNDTMINGASWSCRPLDNIVAMMSHLNQEKARSHMVEQWLEKEHKFAQKGYLPHIAMKLGQL